jgi:hypothetical protein
MAKAFQAVEYVKEKLKRDKLEQENMLLFTVSLYENGLERIDS